MKMKSMTRVLGIMAMLAAGTLTSFQAMAHEDNRRDHHRDNTRYQQRDHHVMQGTRYHQRYMQHDSSGYRKWHASHARHHGHKHRYGHRHQYRDGVSRHDGRHPGYYFDDGRVGITLYYRGTL